MPIDILGEQIGLRDIKALCRVYSCDDRLKEELFPLIFDPDERVGYNALWVLTHLPANERKFLISERDRLIDLLLAESHIGKKRLILTLLEMMPTTPEDFRTDYFDFCLSKINSAEPYAIRALCMKQAFAQCQLYPDLLREFENELELLEYGPLSPGLKSAKKNILKKIGRMKK